MPRAASAVRSRAATSSGSRTSRKRWGPDGASRSSRRVGHATLPAPGGEAELTEWAADFWSHRMDRSAPLWEVALVDGLASGGWAMVTKTHHCMVDGVGSVDLAHL